VRSALEWIEEPAHPFDRNRRTDVFHLHDYFGRLVLDANANARVSALY
jgi:hypothetical protein